jgi:hypothetical protein
MRNPSLTAAILALMLSPYPAAALDAPDELVPARTVQIRGPGKLVRLVARPASGKFALPDAMNDPRHAEGSELAVFDAGGSGGADHYPLPRPGWNGIGVPPGTNGFRYQGTGSASDPCRLVLVKPTVLKALCTGPAVTLSPPFDGRAEIVLTLGGSKRYCVSAGGTTVANSVGRLIRRNPPPPAGCAIVPPTTTSTTTTSTTVTTTTPTCCSAVQLQAVSDGGTMTIDNLAPVALPAGITLTMNVGAPDGTCAHPLVVPAGGFSMPVIDFPALNYCGTATPLGCVAGDGLGVGTGWDGHASCADADVSSTFDTSDGVCDTTTVVVGTCTGGAQHGNPCVQPGGCPGGTCTGSSGCNTTPTGAGGNLSGDLDVTLGDGDCDPSGMHAQASLLFHAIVWSDNSCSPAITPGCCSASNYNPADGDLVITEADFRLDATTATATGAFTDKNGDLCRRAGSGFANPNADGPKTLSGTPVPGPCCQSGQRATIVAVGAASSGGAPVYDVGFTWRIPMLVSACNSYPADPGSCALTDDPCFF